MRSLIDDLLAFARFSRQGLDKEPIQISNLVKLVVDELQPERRERRIEVRLGPPHDCEADPSLLRQVFLNLLLNAFKFTRTRDPARIEIGSRQAGPEIIYFIQDNGVGFDMRRADKLFAIFHRLHNSKEFEGSGVGLSIVQRIVARHGGRVWAEGKVNQGATFSFSLPRPAAPGE
jgi:hypothetical protein